MNKRNWNNGGCCLDAEERKAMKKEWKKFYKICIKMVNKLAKMRKAMTEKEWAHVMWDIQWAVGEKMDCILDDKFSEHMVEGEFDKINAAHRKHVCECHRELGYHYDDVNGCWTKKED